MKRHHHNPVAGISLRAGANWVGWGHLAITWKLHAWFLVHAAMHEARMDTRNQLLDSGQFAGFQKNGTN